MIRIEHRRRSSWALTLHVALAGALALLAGCEIPAEQKGQTGYRGTGMVDVQNPRIVADKRADNVVPPAQPPAPPVGPPAKAVYQNVQVLGDLSVGQFARLMVAITSWVSPKEGCNYCHNPANLADDSVYTKIVARKMIEMTQTINSQWQAHVQQTGVTCWTCHRGQAVPSESWHSPEETVRARYAGNRAHQNIATPAVNSSSLPYTFGDTFLVDDQPISVIGKQALPVNSYTSIKQTEWTYALMMHMSQSLGVNCTYCHNSRSFNNWAESLPTRTTAWHGIRMVRQINNDYILPTKPVLPPNRLGPLGDPAKVGCATCHRGVAKPLYGVSMLADYRELAAPIPAPDAATPADGAVPDDGGMPVEPASESEPVVMSGAAGARATSMLGIDAGR